MEAALRARYSPRVQPGFSTGADDLAALQRSLGLGWWAPTTAPGELAPAARELAGDLAARAEAAAERQRQGLRTARLAQATRMRASALDLQRLIRQDVESAVRATALANGVLLRVVPLEAPAGGDMTRQCAQWLRSTWPQR